MTQQISTAAVIVSLAALYGPSASGQEIGGGVGVEPAPKSPKLEKRVESLEREVARLRAKVARLEAQKAWPPSTPAPSTPAPQPEPPSDEPAPVQPDPLPKASPKRVRKLTPLRHLRIATEVPGETRADALRLGRLRAGWEVANRILGEACVSRLDPHQRRAVRKAAADSFLGERVLPLPSGAWSYRARAELAATRSTVLASVDLDRRLGKLQFVLVGRRIRGPRAARLSAIRSCAKLLEAHGLERAASRDPRAPLVCTLRGKVALRGGIIRCINVTGRVYDRRTGAVIARIHLAPQRTILKGDPDEAVARFGRVVGREVGRGMAQGLLASVVPPCTD